MTFLCNVSGHIVASTSVENQGFRFSRCGRCNHDMIRSTASPDAMWKPVPEGFRVDWGGTDLGAFKRKSWIVAQAVAVTNAVALVVSVTRFVASVLLGRMVDGLRGSNRHGKRALDAVGRVIRVAQPRPGWNVSVEISVGRGRKLDQAFRNEALAR